MAELPGESRSESAAPSLPSTVWGDKRDDSDPDAEDASSSQTLPQGRGEPDAWRDGVERSWRDAGSNIASSAVISAGTRP